MRAQGTILCRGWHSLVDCLENTPSKVSRALLKRVIKTMGFVVCSASVVTTLIDLHHGV